MNNFVTLLMPFFNCCSNVLQFSVIELQHRCGNGGSGRGTFSLRHRHKQHHFTFESEQVEKVYSHSRRKDTGRKDSFVEMGNEHCCRRNGIRSRQIVHERAFIISQESGKHFQLTGIYIIFPHKGNPQQQQQF